MEDKDKIYRGGGITGIDLLQTALIILKLCGVLKCSWWLVLLPLWICIGLAIIIIIIYFIVNH